MDVVNTLIIADCVEWPIVVSDHRTSCLTTRQILQEMRSIPSLNQTHNIPLTLSPSFELIQDSPQQMFAVRQIDIMNDFRTVIAISRLK